MVEELHVFMVVICIQDRVKEASGLYYYFIDSFHNYRAETDKDPIVHIMNLELEMPQFFLLQISDQK